MHTTQQKILHILDAGPIEHYTLRGIGNMIGEQGSAQKIKHHLDQLVKKGLIVIDKKNNTIKKPNHENVEFSQLISLPIYGTADCGVATHFADDYPEGYLKVSKTLLGSLTSHLEQLFVVRATGNSMNRAELEGEAIDSGDYVIIDRSYAQQKPKNGEYVLSVIDHVANIKKVHVDEKKKQVVLLSESYEDIPPIFIHEDDLDSYSIAGKVMRVMKQPENFDDFQDAAASDTLQALGPISHDEHDYYMNI